MKSMNESLTGDMVNWRSRLWDAEEQIEQMRVQMAQMSVVEERKEEDNEKEDLRKELTAAHKTLATYEEAIGQMVRDPHCNAHCATLARCRRMRIVVAELCRTGKGREEGLAPPDLHAPTHLYAQTH